MNATNPNSPRTPLPFNAQVVVPGSTDLSGYIEKGRFVEVGYEWIAYEPNSDGHFLVLQVSPVGAPVTQEILIPMWHDNRFGLDVEDLGALEAVTDYLISEISSPESSHKLFHDGEV